MSVLCLLLTFSYMSSRVYDEEDQLVIIKLQQVDCRKKVKTFSNKYKTSSNPMMLFLIGCQKSSKHFDFLLCSYMFFLDLSLQCLVRHQNLFEKTSWLKFLFSCILCGHPQMPHCILNDRKVCN